MNNPDISSTNQKNSITKYFPPLKDTGIRALTYGGTSLLLGRVNPVSLAISTFNAITVSFATQFTKEDATVLKKTLVKALALGVSALVMSKVAPALTARAAVSLTQDFVIKLAFFNALGEAVLFVIPYLASLSTLKLP